MKFTLLIFLFLGFTASVFPQSGVLKGKALDAEKGEAIPFASIAIFQGGKQFGSAVADVNGQYTIKPISPGRYELKASHLEYNSITIQNIIIPPDQITFVNIKMTNKITNLKVVEVIQYKVPLISKDQTESGQTMTSEEIEKMPLRTAESAASLVGGVAADENGNIGGIRGQREDATVYYIDGVRVTGSYSLPQSAIDQVSVITGGLPAQYGDATGGIINITTKGPSREFGGGAHLQTSQFTDRYGYNLLEFNLQGPLLKSKKDSVNKKPARLGFFISGDISSIKDPHPFSDGYYQVNSNTLSNLQSSPLSPSASGSGMYMSSEYVGNSNVEKVLSKQNAGVKGFNLSGKMDVSTTQRSNLTFGGSMNYNSGKLFNYVYSFLDQEHFPLVTDNTWRAYSQYSHRFANKENSLIKNVFYSVQVDYSRFKEVIEDPIDKNNLFDYGYVGKFTTHKSSSYELGTDKTTGLKNVYIQNGFADTLVEFQRSDINPLLSNYTSQYYSLYNLYSGKYKNLDTIQSNRAQLVNGTFPPKVNDLWANTGSPDTSYSINKNSVFEIHLNGSADIKNHAIQFGFEFQRDDRKYYSCSPVALWTLMRQLANRQITQMDVNNPHLLKDANGVFQDTISYDRLYAAKDQSTFDYNLRKSMGLPVDGKEWIDVDSYDPQRKTINYITTDNKIHTASLGQDLSLKMFSADEILNQGQPYATYWGYDYTGKELKSGNFFSNSSISNFTDDKDQMNNFLRKVDAYRPIYMAGYIQDKFAFKDLIFNIGLRVDRFDANQQVLKDPFLLSEAHTVGETKTQFNHPSNMGNDYVVYVDDMLHPTSVMGYRNGYTWYDAKGNEISDPKLIASSQGIQPYLVDPSQHFSANAFTNYTPVINVMPRIAFSFPISDEALFFAHYDVLTRRPTYFESALNPVSYFFLGSATGNQIISNPNLKPERTIDYEVGFQQKVTNSSSIKLSAYYREIRDQINVYEYYGAYPQSYLSYANRDYSTIKGMTLMYDLRHTGNIWLKANYTLQFANGTGSNSTSALSQIESGQPNLRLYGPLSYDRRHEIKTIIDFRFGDNQDYNGPRININKKNNTQKTILLLENTGINFTFWAGSGNPYTAKSLDGTTLSGGYLTGGNTIGSPYGARLPWQFRVDARIDKDIVLKSGSTKKKNILMNIYVQVLNLLNLKNVMYVYSTTGNPNDNGYLTAAQYASQISVQTSPQAYKQQYAMFINNPYNYSMPRQIRIGVEIKF